MCSKPLLNCLQIQLLQHLQLVGFAVGRKNEEKNPFVIAESPALIIFNLAV